MPLNKDRIAAMKEVFDLRDAGEPVSDELLEAAGFETSKPKPVPAPALVVEPPKIDVPSLPDYYDMLARHDWYYEMSDDHRVWKAGSARAGELRTIAKAGGEEYEKLLLAFGRYYTTFSDRGPKPEKPNV